MDLHNLDGFRAVVLPEYYDLETYTHEQLPDGTSVAKAAETVKTILLALSGITFEVKPLKGKYKVSYAANAELVIFVLRFWWRSQALVFEACRRSGSIPTFMRLYRDILFAMKQADFDPERVVVLSELGTPQLINDGTPLLDGAEANAGAEGAPHPSENDMNAFVRSLKEMVESGQVDSMLEGTRALVRLSADPDERMRLHQQHVVAALASVLEAKPSKMFGQFGTACEFFAVSCMAHLSEEPFAHASLPMQLLLPLVRSGNYVDAGMRQEAARAIRNVAQGDPGAFVRTVGGRDVLLQWHSAAYESLDAELQKYVDHVMEVVG